jgi:hypothetical protein
VEAYAIQPSPAEPKSGNQGQAPRLRRSDLDPRRSKAPHLHDAATYITKLPKCEHDAPEWQAAIEALMLVAERGGPTMFARIGIMRALNKGKTGLDRTRRRNSRIVL